VALHDIAVTLHGNHVSMVINTQMKLGNNQPATDHHQIEFLMNAMQWRAMNIRHSVQQNNYGYIILTKADVKHLCTFAEEICAKIVKIMRLS
jgi:hypothetical protein